jgi:hypothetical protein
VILYLLLLRFSPGMSIVHSVEKWRWLPGFVGLKSGSFHFPDAPAAGDNGGRIPKRTNELEQIAKIIKRKQQQLRGNWEELGAI